MKIKTILFCLLALACAASAQWNIFNPKYGGNMQFRAGYQYDTEADTVNAYAKMRAVVDENIEVMVGVTNNSITTMSVRFDLFDLASPFLAFSNGELKAGTCVYYDIGSFSLAGETAYLARADEVEVGGEVDYFFWKFIAYLGGTYATDKTLVPYTGIVYVHNDHWELGATLVQIYYDSEHLTNLVSADVTLKF